MKFLKKMRMNRIFNLPRYWSNREMKRFSHLFTGNIINVSGWKDADKEGSFYKDYFINAEEYHISNIHGECGDESEKSIFIDLEKPLDKDLKGRFDVVFNHTTLEHIYDVKTAFNNICSLSKDIVILVVPFSQPVHYSKSGDWYDYWRFTPFSIKKMFENNGFELVYLSSNDNFAASIYLFCIATKNPEKWKNREKDFDKVQLEPSMGLKNMHKVIKLLLNFIGS